MYSSIQKPLSREEINYVLRAILKALNVLHDDGYVHTDDKLGNIFVSYRKTQGEVRFSDGQLDDFGDQLPPKSSTLIGAPMWSSPEFLMEMPLVTATNM